jgi:hypothetical protein
MPDISWVTNPCAEMVSLNAPTETSPKTKRPSLPEIADLAAAAASARSMCAPSQTFPSRSAMTPWMLPCATGSRVC